MMENKVQLAQWVREEGLVQWVCLDQGDLRAMLVKLERLEVPDRLGRGV